MKSTIFPKYQTLYETDEKKTTAHRKSVNFQSQINKLLQSDSTKKLKKPKKKPAHAQIICMKNSLKVFSNLKCLTTTVQ